MTQPDTLELATVMLEEVRRRLAVLDRITWHVAALRALIADQRHPDAGLFRDAATGREQTLEAALRRSHKAIEEAIEGMGLPKSLWERTKPPLSRVERARRWQP